MKTIAKNANDFSSIRMMDHGNCIYVDKTDYFHRLVTAPAENLFFIARPRRGKRQNRDNIRMSAGEDGR